MQPVLKAMMEAERVRRAEEERLVQACAKTRAASQGEMVRVQAELNAELNAKPSGSELAAEKEEDIEQEADDAARDSPVPQEDAAVEVQ